MSLTSDEHHVAIGDHAVTVRGTTGTVHATWTLLVDGVEADSATAAGDFTLQGVLPDDSRVEAQIHQSLVGFTGVVVVHDGEEVGRFKGFVA